MKIFQYFNSVTFKEIER